MEETKEPQLTDCSHSKRIYQKTDGEKPQFDLLYNLNEDNQQWLALRSPSSPTNGLEQFRPDTRMVLPTRALAALSSSVRPAHVRPNGSSLLPAIRLPVFPLAAPTLPKTSTPPLAMILPPHRGGGDHYCRPRGSDAGQSNNVFDRINTVNQAVSGHCRRRRGVDVNPRSPSQVSGDLHGPDIVLRGCRKRSPCCHPILHPWREHCEDGILASTLRLGPWWDAWSGTAESYLVSCSNLEAFRWLFELLQETLAVVTRSQPQLHQAQLTGEEQHKELNAEDAMERKDPFAAAIRLTSLRRHLWELSRRCLFLANNCNRIQLLLWPGLEVTATSSEATKSTFI
ncbi:hypothetical protein HPP92_006201 [Vanilla planifolia]|uniref:Uncharacterized protein n=1 Tax=Vanilla planifolia TaxID=51239 RepID=A0A835VA26_VANPL|nr:hypothetical protein HPP92_006502 [Vanilla planifolia]KAG0495207.1 hypothetical protein HPP92_006201 [Vanilla planifolia]